MTKKIQKKINVRRPAKAASENQFGVILEDINSKLGLVVEGHVALDKKIDDFKEEFVEFKRDTESNFKTIFEFQKDTESNFKTVLQHLLNIDKELEFIKSEISEIKKTLTQKADLNRVAILEERVARLERQLAAAK